MEVESSLSEVKYSRYFGPNAPDINGKESGACGINSKTQNSNYACKSSNNKALSVDRSLSLEDKKLRETTLTKSKYTSQFHCRREASTSSALDTSSVRTSTCKSLLLVSQSHSLDSAVDVRNGVKNSYPSKQKQDSLQGTSFLQTAGTLNKWKHEGNSDQPVVIEDKNGEQEEERTFGEGEISKEQILSLWLKFFG